MEWGGGACRASRDWKNFEDVGGGGSGERACVRCDPQEQRIEGANKHLQEANGEREALGSTGRVESQLVVQRVVVIAQVPSSEASEEAEVDRAEGVASSYELALLGVCDDPCGEGLGRGRSSMQAQGRPHGSGRENPDIGEGRA